MGSLASAAGTTPGFPQLQDVPEDAFRRAVSNAISNILRGKLTNAGSFTLKASATSTTVSDARAGINSVILWSPRTSNAAGAMTNLYAATKTNGSFILAHSSTATSDRTFDYVVIG